MKWDEKLHKLLKGRVVASLSREMGLYHTRLGAQISRKQMPRADRAVKLARLLGVDTDWLFDDDLGWPPVRVPVGPTPQGSVTTADTDQTNFHEEAHPGPLLSFEVQPRDYMGPKSFRLVGQTERIDVEDYSGQADYVPVLSPVAAGEARRSDYWGNRPALAEYYVKFQTEDRRAFALPVDGASMEPDLRHGDLVIASPSAALKPPIEQLHNPILAIVVFRSERTATLKLFIKSEPSPAQRRAKYVLQPINKLYPNVTVAASEIGSVIPVLGLIREMPK